MTNEVLANLIANQCCPQCNSTNVIVGVDTNGSQDQEVPIECDICGWEYKTTLKDLQDAGFCLTCSADDVSVIDSAVIQLGDTAILLEVSIPPDEPIG